MKAPTSLLFTLMYAASVVSLFACGVQFYRDNFESGFLYLVSSLAWWATASASTRMLLHIRHCHRGSTGPFEH